MSPTVNNTFFAGFGVSSSGALSVLPSSPYNNGVAAQSLAVTPANTFLYAGTTNGIFGYTINSNGSITVLNSGNSAGAGRGRHGHAGRQHRGLFARGGHCDRDPDPVYWRLLDQQLNRDSDSTHRFSGGPLHRQCFHRDPGYTHGNADYSEQLVRLRFARFAGGAGIDAGFGGRSHYDRTRHYSAAHQYFDQPIGRRAGERSEFPVSVRG